MSIHRKSHGRKWKGGQTDKETERKEIAHQITMTCMNDGDFLKGPRGIDSCIFLPKSFWRKKRKRKRTRKRKIKKDTYRGRDSRLMIKK